MDQDHPLFVLDARMSSYRPTAVITRRTYARDSGSAWLTIAGRHECEY